MSTVQGATLLPHGEARHSLHYLGKQHWIKEMTKPNWGNCAIFHLDALPFLKIRFKFDKQRFAAIRLETLSVELRGI